MHARTHTTLTTREQGVFSLPFTRLCLLQLVASKPVDAATIDFEHSDIKLPQVSSACLPFSSALLSSTRTTCRQVRRKILDEIRHYTQRRKTTVSQEEVEAAPESKCNSASSTSAHTASTLSPPPTADADGNRSSMCFTPPMTCTPSHTRLLARSSPSLAHPPSTHSSLYTLLVCPTAQEAESFGILHRVTTSYCPQADQRAAQVNPPLSASRMALISPFGGRRAVIGRFPLAFTASPASGDRQGVIFATCSECDAHSLAGTPGSSMAGPNGGSEVDGVQGMHVCPRLSCAWLSGSVRSSIRLNEEVHDTM